MTPEKLISMARSATFDTQPDKNTWEDKQYLLALNEARAYLYGKCPEVRVTAVVGLTAYAAVEEEDIAEEMAEDAVYLPFYVEYMAWKFFDSGTDSESNSRKAREHKAGMAQALMALAGR
jgi:hypothetical protein